jgi:hypothetical protein
MTHRCDGHYLECIRGNPFRQGIAVGGGATSGEMRDNHFKPGSRDFASYEAALEAFVLGDCRNEIIFQNMVFATRVGYHFISQNGRGAAGLALGAGTDGTSQAIVCDNLDKAGFDFINAGIDVFHHVRGGQRDDKGFVILGKQCNAEVRFYNTFFGGMPNYCTWMDNGSIGFEVANFRRFAPFVVNAGTLSLLSSFLGEDKTGGRQLFSAKPSAPIQIIGTYVPSAITTTPSTPAGSVVEKGNIRYTVTAPRDE